MNGPIAQIAALTSFGNAYLLNKKSETFFPKNSTCVFCEKIVFMASEKSFWGKVANRVVANSPDNWFSYLKSQGTKGILLSRRPRNLKGMPDRISSAFVGGGEIWALEILLPNNKSEFWIDNWQVGNKDALDKRIWQVTYERIVTAQTHKINVVSLNKVKCNLLEALLAINAFSDKYNLTPFSEVFKKALETLNSNGKIKNGYHKDLAPEGLLSEEALTLLDACQTSWVFGGMGSWNDLGGFKDEQNTYDNVSEQLFLAVNKAIATAVNSIFICKI